MTKQLTATIALLSLVTLPGTYAHAQSATQFPDAGESVPELIELYTQSDSGCRLSRSKDVKVVVACLSRAVYGAALNERDWCLGKQGQANADMAWHECQSDSMRFSPLKLPEF
ncbi:MAG: hypothetical protein WBA88_21930 [Pseudaminobacter sp.]